MSDYQPPKNNTPIALRLVPRITGYTVRDLFSILTEPIPHSDRDSYYLYAYQWPNKKHTVPVSALKLLLEPAMKANTFRGEVVGIPPNLFVWPDDLERCKFDCYFDAAGERPPFSDRPDWNPNIHDIEDLVRKCPPPLWTICNIPRHKSREQGKKETAERNALLQEKCKEILMKMPGLSKKDIAKRLGRMPEVRDLATETIERIIRVRVK